MRCLSFLKAPKTIFGLVPPHLLHSLTMRPLVENGEYLPQLHSFSKNTAIVKAKTNQVKIQLQE